MPHACRFKDTIFEILGGVKELIFNYLGWGDDDAVQLAVVLLLCANLTKLTLVGNTIGGRGMAALALAIAVSRSLTELRLQGNAIGDVGAEALAGALVFVY